MKKLLSALGTVLLFPAMALASFSDVPASNQFYDAINYVQSKGIVQGYPDKSFKPDQLINRAEFTTIIIKSLYSADKYQNCTPAIKFPDVVVSDWFHPYICMTVNQGIAHGYPDNTFKPANNLNFAEISKMLVEAYDIGSSAAGGPWYQQYVVAIEKLNAKPTSIKQPNQQITRGEMAEMIYKLKSSVPAWAKGSTVPATGATEEVKALFEKISKLTNLEDYYPYLSKANLNEIKNLVSMISIEEGDPFAESTVSFSKSNIKSLNLPGNLTEIPIISVSDNGSHRKVVISRTVSGYTLTACMGLLKEDGSWKIDDYLLGPMEIMNDKCNDAKTYVGLLDSANLVASRLTYSAEYEYKVYLNGYYIVKGSLGGGVKDAKLPLLKGTNRLRIEMSESLKKYIVADDPFASLAETINGLKLKIEADSKTLVDVTQSEGSMIKTVDFTY